MLNAIYAYYLHFHKNLNVVITFSRCHCRISTLQVRTLGHREVRDLAPGYTARKRQNGDSNLAPVLLTVMMPFLCGWGNKQALARGRRKKGKPVAGCDRREPGELEGQGGSSHGWSTE